MGGLLVLASHPLGSVKVPEPKIRHPKWDAPVRECERILRFWMLQIDQRSHINTCSLVDIVSDHS